MRPDTSLLTPPLAGSSNFNFPPKQSTGWKINTEKPEIESPKEQNSSQAEWWFLAQGQRRSYCLFRFGIKVKTMFKAKVRVRNSLFRVTILLWEFRKSSEWEIRVTGVFEWVHKRQRNNEWNQEWQREHTARAQPLMWNQSGRGFRLAVASHVRLRRCWTLTGADWWGPSLYSLMMLPQSLRGKNTFLFF